MGDTLSLPPLFNIWLKTTSGFLNRFFRALPNMSYLFHIPSSSVKTNGALCHSNSSTSTVIFFYFDNFCPHFFSHTSSSLSFFLPFAILPRTTYSSFAHLLILFLFLSLAHARIAFALLSLSLSLPPRSFAKSQSTRQVTSMSATARFQAVEGNWLYSAPARSSIYAHTPFAGITPCDAEPSQNTLLHIKKLQFARKRKFAIIRIDYPSSRFIAHL